VLAEYKEVLKRLHVRSAAIGTLINIIRELGEPVEIRYSDEVSPDPKDDAFCLCAEAGRADIIFTLNPRDFPQDRLKAKVIEPHPTMGRHSR
jgi:predicted nucleic acid-binding protein